MTRNSCCGHIPGIVLLTKMIKSTIPKVAQYCTSKGLINWPKFILKAKKCMPKSGVIIMCPCFGVVTLVKVTTQSNINRVSHI